MFDDKSTDSLLADISAYPKRPARGEHDWRRYEVAKRLNDQGLTLGQIGAKLNVTKERARQMIKKWHRGIRV